MELKRKGSLSDQKSTFLPKIQGGQTNIRDTGLPPRKKVNEKPEKAKTSLKKYSFFMILIIIVASIVTYKYWLSPKKTIHVSTDNQKVASTSKNEQNQIKGEDDGTHSISPSPQATSNSVPQQEEALPKVENKPQEIPVEPTGIQEKKENNPPVKHLVIPGETLYRISLKYYHTGRYSDFLAKYNHLASASDLAAGTVIRVPFPPTE